MLLFTAESWVPMSHGRRGAVIPAGEYEGYNPLDLLGQRVCIDGDECRVLNVDMFAIAYSQEQPYRLPFMLIVEVCQANDR